MTLDPIGTLSREEQELILRTRREAEFRRGYNTGLAQAVYRLSVVARGSSELHATAEVFARALEELRLEPDSDVRMLPVSVIRRLRDHLEWNVHNHTNGWGIAQQLLAELPTP